MRLFETGQTKAERSQLVRGMGQQSADDLLATLPPPTPPGANRAVWPPTRHARPGGQHEPRSGRRRTPPPLVPTDSPVDDGFPANSGGSPDRSFPSDNGPAPLNRLAADSGVVSNNSFSRGTSESLRTAGLVGTSRRLQLDLLQVASDPSDVAAAGSVGLNRSPPASSRCPRAAGACCTRLNRRENVEPAMWSYEISGKQILLQWFSYRKANRERPIIGDKRPPSPLGDIQPDHWLAEYTTELINVLHVLGGLVDLEPSQRELLDKICVGPLILAGELQDVLARGSPQRRRRPASATQADRPSSCGSQARH